MKIRNFFISILATWVVLLNSCNPKTPVANLQPQGSSLNPTAVPLNVRLRELEKGNLITNPSFELGRNYMSDTLKLSFNLPGWTKVGENVYWTNIENGPEYEIGDASNGIHSIKIFRERVNETDNQGEGILSDYIKVIPGNYHLRMDLRLRNPLSSMDRLGTGLFDAINIRLLCYDKNKVLIKNHFFHPGYDHLIDNSFKGFAFSNLKEINEFGWSRIIARSGNFPFDEGNLPEGTRYVKVFIGLKGPGEMWVDWVDFRYSHSNFTMLEELMPVMDSTLERIEYLVPRPQTAQYPKVLELISTDASGEEYKPVILVPGNVDRTSLNIIRNFEKRLRETGIFRKEDKIITNRINQKDLETLPVIFSIGNTSLAGSVKSLPHNAIEDRNQSYFIKRLNDTENVIFIGYSDSEGLSHAFHTLGQLISDTQLDYHHYDIVDFPWYQNRSLIIPVYDSESWEPMLKEDELRYLAQSGVNSFITEPNKSNPGMISLQDIPSGWVKNLETLENEFPYLQNGYSLSSYRSSELLNTYIQNGKEINEKVRQRINSESQILSGVSAKLSTGNRKLILSDLFLWEVIMEVTAGNDPGIADKTRFYEFLELSSLLWREFNSSASRLYFKPALYHNRIKDNFPEGVFRYFRILETEGPDWKSILWSGSAMYPDFIDKSDLYAYLSDNKLQTTLFDQTLTIQKSNRLNKGYASLYPGKALLASIFEPYDTEIAGISPSDFNNEVFIRINGNSPLDVIRTATAMDYLWNPSAYSPVFSTYKVLLQLFDKDYADEMIQFNNLYFRLSAVCIDLENNGFAQRAVKLGEEIIIQMNYHWDNLEGLSNDHLDLLNDLNDYKNTVISRFYRALDLPPVSIP